MPANFMIAASALRTVVIEIGRIVLRQTFCSPGKFEHRLAGFLLRACPIEQFMEAGAKPLQVLPLEVGQLRHDFVSAHDVKIATRHGAK
jgi:hypothetical protein